MVYYINGKIYKLVCDNPELVYIGSTAQKYLSSRLCQHQQSKNRCCSKQLLEAGNMRIVLVENYPCESKDELRMREEYHIANMDCINIKKAYTSPEERKEMQKQYAIDNRDKILENKRIYGERTKEQKKEYDRLNYLKKREAKLEQAKEYYELNKQSLSDKRKQKKST
tara:strand:+ start:67 stop:570 length:504 start_codon:yes stop_codon:yes gene_type:complete